MNALSPALNCHAYGSPSFMSLFQESFGVNEPLIIDTSSVSSGTGKEDATYRPMDMKKIQESPVASSVITAQAPIRAEICDESVKENNKNYEIDITYPRINSGIQDNARKNINNQLKAYIDTRVNDFKADAEQAVPIESIGINSDIQMSHTEMANNERFISMTFGSSTFVVGWAHPSNDLTTFNFDSKTGNSISFRDLFSKDTAEGPEVSHLFRNNHEALRERENLALKKVSEYCINDLKKQNEGKPDDEKIDDSLIESVTAPDYGNYNVFNLTDSGLVINFFYCHAAGYGEVKIPYEALADLVNPHGVLGQYAKQEEKKPPVVVDVPNLEITDDMIIIDDVMLKISKARQ